MKRSVVLWCLVAVMSALVSPAANAWALFNDGSWPDYWQYSFGAGARCESIALDNGDSALRMIHSTGCSSRVCFYQYYSNSSEPARVVAARFRIESADTDWSTILCQSNSSSRVGLVLTKIGGIQHLVVGQLSVTPGTSYLVVHDLGPVPYGDFHTAYLHVTSQAVKLRWDGVESVLSLPRPHPVYSCVEFGSGNWHDRYYSSNTASAATVTFDWVAAGFTADYDAVPEPTGALSLAGGLVGLIPVLRRRKS